MLDVCVYIFKCIACSLLVYVCKTERGLDIPPTAASQYITHRASKGLAQEESACAVASPEGSIVAYAVLY